MTLLQWRRPSIACAPCPALLYRSERAYWLAVGLVLGRVRTAALRRWT